MLSFYMVASLAFIDLIKSLMIWKGVYPSLDFAAIPFDRRFFTTHTFISFLQPLVQLYTFMLPGCSLYLQP